MVMLYHDDPKKLTEALAEFSDTVRSGGYGGLREADQTYVRDLVKKWAPYLGEEVEVDGKVYKLHPIRPNLWPMMAMAFENQQAFNKPAKDTFEALTKSQVSLPDEYTLPIIREIFPSLIMNSICSVQPMPLQSGGVMNVYWLKFYRENVSPEAQVTTNDSDYAVSSEQAIPKKMRFKITNTSVTAVTDKLNAEWTTEVAEDARGTMGLDVESELVQAMAQEMLRELEQRTLMDILGSAAAGNTNWSHTVPSGYIAKEWYETIFHAVIDAEKLVRATRYRNANYIIAGDDALAYFMKAATFVMDGTAVGPQLDGPLPSGVKFEGRIGNRWDLYSSSYITAAKAIVSYYPESVTHAGYIWAPYVPIMPMPLVYGGTKDFDDATLPGAVVNNDSWNRNIRTRNGHYYAEPNMFATITVT